MNRRLFVSTSMLAAASVVVPTALAQSGGDGKVGKMEMEEFKKMNKQGGAKVKALKASPEPLSEADQKLMMEVAMGGMMQLEASQVAVKMASSPDVKAIAQAEVEEQTILSAKLKEVAKAKGMTMPSAPDEKTQKMVSKLQGMSGAEFDRAYLRESGVKGHQALKATMTRVESKAADPTLKALASTTLPLINTHLQVSEEEVSAMA